MSSQIRGSKHDVGLTIRQHICEAIVRARLDASLTISAIAREVGISRKAWLRYEAGISMPSDVLHLFAQQVGKPVADFLPPMKRRTKRTEVEQDNVELPRAAA